ncbi:MAG TPA: thiamine phosphate synthase [Methylophilaceae bacterium]|nr:thiamine phosphate synthase [Methylophilaceae bacterium]
MLLKTNKFNISGLYAVTPDLANTEQLCSMVQAAITGGASVVQYRNKTADAKLRIAQAQALLEICRDSQIPLIINDHVKLCLALDADGIHIGATDGDLAAVRERIGADKILGASCYNRMDLALHAQEQGVDYVAFGACFNSDTKPNAPKAELSLFTQAQTNIKVPVVGIGGITLDNAPSLIAAGAYSIAVINALWNTPDIAETAQKFSNLFN